MLIFCGRPSCVYNNGEVCCKPELSKGVSCSGYNHEQELEFDKILQDTFSRLKNLSNNNTL